MTIEQTNKTALLLDFDPQLELATVLRSGTKELIESSFEHYAKMAMPDCTIVALHLDGAIWQLKPRGQQAVMNWILSNSRSEHVYNLAKAFAEKKTNDVFTQVANITDLALIAARA